MFTLMDTETLRLDTALSFLLVYFAALSGACFCTSWQVMKFRKTPNIALDPILPKKNYENRRG